MSNDSGCKALDCPQGYIPTCVKCYTVNVQCATCGQTYDFLPEDPERGDRFVRELPVKSWMCPLCGAMEIGVSERSIDHSTQSTLEAFG